MATHKIKVTQVLRTVRTMVLEVEADTAEEAREAVDLGEVDKPSDASLWDRTEVVQHEECEAVP